MQYTVVCCDCVRNRLMFFCFVRNLRASSATCTKHTAYGRAVPQFGQNFSVFSEPHAHVHVCTCASSGFAAPQFEQNLPVLVAPHEHVHVGAGSGFALPQLLQNLPVFCVPHEHTHPACAPAAPGAAPAAPATAPAAAACCCMVFMACAPAPKPPSAATG